MRRSLETRKLQSLLYSALFTASLFYKEAMQKLQEEKQKEVEHIRKRLETVNIDVEVCLFT